MNKSRSRVNDGPLCEEVIGASMPPKQAILLEADRPVLCVAAYLKDPMSLVSCRLDLVDEARSVSSL